MLNNNKGFSFVETIVVIVLIGVCFAIWGFHGREHVKLSVLREAEMFSEKIIAQEKNYYADNGHFYFTIGTDKVTEILDLSISTKENKYFKDFRIKEGTETPKTVIVEMYIDKTKYPDMENYSITSTYYPNKDIIDYQENYE